MRWILSLLFLAGCARFPKDEIQCERIETPSLETTTAGAREEEPFVYGNFPDERWWQDFEDEQLCALIERALDNQPSLKRAMARVQAADEESQAVRSALFPMVNLYAQGAQQYFGKNGFFRAFAPTFPGRINEYQLELNFSYEFDFWGKNRALFEASLGEARAQAAEACQVKIMLSTSVALAYFNWQIEKRRQELLEEEDRLIGDRFLLTAQRKTSALDNQQQTLTAHSQQLDVKKKLVKSVEVLKHLENRLKMLLGMGPDDCLSLELHALPSDAKVALPCDLSNNLLARRPDLTAIIWRVESAAKRVGAARTDFYPSINLTALAGLDSVFLGKFFSWNSRAANAIPALYLPIFTGGLLRARLKERQAEFAEATYTYNELLLEAVREVADQIATVKMAHNQLALQREIVRQKSQTNDLVAKRQTVGISSNLDLIDSRANLLLERLTEMDDIFLQLASTIGLIKALGGGFSCL